MGWPPSVDLTFDFYLVIFIRAVTGVTRNAVMKINRPRAEVQKSILELNLHRREAPDGHR